MPIHYQDQLERIDRLLAIVNAPDQNTEIGGLRFEDVLAFACQSMWHLKDWILNDPMFLPDDPSALVADIHSTRCLMICADIANGSKHAILSRPRTDFSLSESTGIHLDQRKGIFQVFYYIVSNDKDDPFHGMEVRPFLAQCRREWERLIDEHRLTGVDRYIAEREADA